MTEKMVSLNSIIRAPEATVDSLKKITMLAESMKRGEEEIERQEEKLKLYKMRLAEIQTVQLPSAMQEAGLKDFTLDSGEKIEVKQIVAASIPAAYKSQAFAWLDESGNGDLIKNEISMSFGREQNDLANQLVEELIARGLSPEQSRGVHSGTLSVFVKEQLAAGNEIPMEILGVYLGQKAVIKQTKGAKKK